ncbi:MAG: hypothetical protein [Bacteriophage sp.]|nr:MAG: hypothetical protein [Bacteriophage sp.]
MPENNSKKSLNETIEDNVRKAYSDKNIDDVLSGSPDEVKDRVADRNKEVIKKAKEKGVSVAHVKVDDDVDELAFSFKDHLLIASDCGIGVIGDIKPNELADTVTSIVKAVLLYHGIDPDKNEFNLNAALVLELSVADFIGNSSTPYKILKRFTRLMDALEELIEE